MIRATTRWALMLIALAAVGCASSLPTTRPVPKKPVVVRNSANGSTITLPPDAQLIVRLASNPTTGYTWKPAVLDTRKLKQVGETYEPSDPGMMGAGGVQIFAFQPQSTGKTVLVLDYLRPREQPHASTRPPAEETTSFTLNVVIDNK